MRASVARLEAALLARVPRRNRDSLASRAFSDPKCWSNSRYPVRVVWFEMPPSFRKGHHGAGAPWIFLVRRQAGDPWSASDEVQSDGVAGVLELPCQCHDAVNSSIAHPLFGCLCKGVEENMQWAQANPQALARLGFNATSSCASSAASGRLRISDSLACRSAFMPGKPRAADTGPFASSGGSLECQLVRTASGFSPALSARQGCIPENRGRSPAHPKAPASWRG